MTIKNLFCFYVPGFSHGVAIAKDYMEAKANVEKYFNAYHGFVPAGIEIKSLKVCEGFDGEFGVCEFMG